MKVRIASTNYKTGHTIVFVPRHDEVLIVTEDGQEIARIYVETSENDVKKGDRYESHPTKNFYVTFNVNGEAVGSRYASAFVQVDPKNEEQDYQQH